MSGEKSAKEAKPADTKMDEETTTKKRIADETETLCLYA